MPVGTAGPQRHKCQKKERLEMPWWGLLEDTPSKVCFFLQIITFLETLTQRSKNGA